MTSANISQGGAEALVRTDADLSVSQGGAEALHRVTPGALASQAGAEVMHRVLAHFRVGQAGAEVLYKARPCTPSEAQLWIIERDDGQTFRLTSHDKDMLWRGEPYAACGGFLPSASESAAEIGAVGNQEMAGIFSAEAGGITREDIEAGLFDGARVECWLVAWNGSTEPPRRLHGGILGKITTGPNGYTTELLGPGAQLQQTPLTRVLKPDCDYVFGGFGCFKDLAPLTVSGSVDSASGDHAFVDAARSETAGYFRRGRVTFTTGANAGLSAEIKTHETGGVFRLWPHLANPIEPGDAYTMTPGCTNLKASDGGCNGCTAWDNVVNYGGFDQVPGGDALSSTNGVRTS